MLITTTVLSEKASKIINVKDILGIGIRCPCYPNDRSRYCGSKKCVGETRLVGNCPCVMFYLRTQYEIWSL